MAFFVLLWGFFWLWLALDNFSLLDGLSKDILVVHGRFFRGFRREVDRRGAVCSGIFALDEILDLLALFDLFGAVFAQSTQKAATHVVIAGSILSGLGGLCGLGGFGNRVGSLAQLIFPVILGLLGSLLLGRHFWGVV